MDALNSSPLLIFVTPAACLGARDDVTGTIRYAERAGLCVMWSGSPGCSGTIIISDQVVVEQFLRVAGEISTLDWQARASPFPFPSPHSRAPHRGRLNARPQTGRCAGLVRRGALRTSWNGGLRQGWRERAITRVSQGSILAEGRSMRFPGLPAVGVIGRRAGGIPRRCAAPRRAGRPTWRRSCCGCSG